MTPTETPMRMLERMIDDTEERKRKGYYTMETPYEKELVNQVLGKHVKDLTILRDKFQQAGEDIEDLKTNSFGQGYSFVRKDDVQRILGTETESVTGSKGYNTSEALNPSLSAVRGLKPAKDRRKLGKAEGGVPKSRSRIAEPPYIRKGKECPAEENSHEHCGVTSPEKKPELVEYYKRTKLGDKVVEELRKDEKFAPSEISLCKSCGCMTHTIYPTINGRLDTKTGKCGKCGGVK